jgi:hypothetical protein
VGEKKFADFGEAFRAVIEGGNEGGKTGVTTDIAAEITE